jgi:hypothetical protein
LSNYPFITFDSQGRKRFCVEPALSRPSQPDREFGTFVAALQDPSRPQRFQVSIEGDFVIDVDWQALGASAGMAYVRQGTTDELVMLLFNEHDADAEARAMAKLAVLLRHLPGFPLERVREPLAERRPLALCVYVRDGGGLATLSIATQFATAFFLRDA